MKQVFIVILLCHFSFTAFSKILPVGTGQTYSNLSSAAKDALPGDTILFHAGVYAGGEHVSNLQGNSARPIHLLAQGQVIIRGGTNSWQLSDPAYLHIEGFIFEQQTGNCFNMDDGGDYTTPAHHITFRTCTFRDINATGNNDLLKLSGVDYFTIEQCIFVNGSGGGSGIDMVGCHWGEIADNQFENMGSNAIQAKGGTSQVTISHNYFKNCGQRTLNLGGSTGLEFFRPLNATYEAAEIKVYSNIFIGSVAPVAFVGCVRSIVAHNTIYRPEKWVLRILQETVDPDRFEACGNNLFVNNLIYKDNEVSTDCNIGPNTAAETFIISHNLWFNGESINNSRPIGLPVAEPFNLIGQDPLLTDLSAEDFSLNVNSPAIGSGLVLNESLTDFIGQSFNNPPSIGAHEGNPPMQQVLITNIESSIDVFPNPSNGMMRIQWANTSIETVTMIVHDVQGKLIDRSIINNGDQWQPHSVTTGTILLSFYVNGRLIGIERLIIL